MIKQIARYILKDEIGLINNTSLEFQKANVLLREEIEQSKKEKELKNYYNNKYPKVQRSQYKTFSCRNLLLDVRLFLGNYNNMKLPIFDGIDDEIVLKAQDWIIDNVTYKSDADEYGLKEYWAMSYETLERKKGDCDDGAILLYDILRYNNIPAWKIRLSAGWVEYNGKKTGHAYVTYYCEELKYWVILDWCYYPNSQPINQRASYKDETKYKDVWFSFNEDYSWTEGLNTEAKKILK